MGVAVDICLGGMAPFGPLYSPQTDIDGHPSARKFMF